MANTSPGIGIIMGECTTEAARMRVQVLCNLTFSYSNMYKFIAQAVQVKGTYIVIVRDKIMRNFDLAILCNEYM